MAKYRARICDEILQDKLEGKGAILIEGPKWCGKTTTAEQLANSVLYMADPMAVSENKVLAEINPSIILNGKAPRLIDEWQIAPKLWDAVRFEVDHREHMGQFILTGSAVPAEKTSIQHTGTGRFAWILMRTMSLYESNESSGEVSLQTLFNAPIAIAGTSEVQIQKLAFMICRGGWPKAIDMKKSVALEQAFDYFDAIVNADISRVDETIRQEERTKRLMREYARNQGTQISFENMRNNMQTNDGGTIDKKTFSSYIEALKKIFVIEDMPAWNPNLRSKTAIRTTDTRYFIDSSIATASLGLGPNDLISDLKTFGFMFETMCVRDLRVYADKLKGKVYHYRDKSGLECDAVVHLRNGTYGLIEIKLGGEHLINEGAKNLVTLADKIDDKKMKKPAFLMVLTGTSHYAYKRREDGVYVVPICCLKD
ncbi:MAG: DUF4143 domain-containing protein [Bacillota bacterium]